MSEQKRLETCTLCGEKLKTEVRKRTYKYQGIPYSCQQEGEWCDSCGEGFFSSEDLKATREIRNSKKKKIDEIVAGTLKEYYRGFSIKVKFDKEAEVFYGEIENSNAIIHSRGKDLLELKVSFREGVEEYLKAHKEVHSDRE